VDVEFADNISNREWEYVGFVGAIIIEFVSRDISVVHRKRYL
jgi:hypothetical protein